MNGYPITDLGSDHNIKTYYKDQHGFIIFFTYHIFCNRSPLPTEASPIFAQVWTWMELAC